MFLWSLIHKQEDELAKKVFLVQCEMNIENYWVEIVKRELQACEINLSFDEIASLDKPTFKKIVKRKIFRCSQQFLSEVQQKQSKTLNLTIANKIKGYLISNKISLIEKQTIYKLRCRIENVKNNYKSMYKNDLTCAFCASPNSIDSYKHYLETCAYFQSHQKFSSKIKNLRYMDLFGNFDNQVCLARIWLEIEKHRKLVIDIT